MFLVHGEFPLKNQIENSLKTHSNSYGAADGAHSLLLNTQINHHHYDNLINFSMKFVAEIRLQNYSE